jgi:ribonuclease D
MATFLGSSWVTARLARRVNPASISWAIAGMRIMRRQREIEQTLNERVRNVLDSQALLEMAKHNPDSAADFVRALLAPRASAGSLFSVLAEAADPDGPANPVLAAPKQYVVLQDTDAFRALVGPPTSTPFSAPAPSRPCRRPPRHSI